MSPGTRSPHARAAAASIVTKHEIWNHSPEKVLGVAEEWLEQYPCTHRAMLGAVIEASVEVDAPERRLEVAHVIAGESFVDAPVEVLHGSLAAAGAAGSGPIFHRYAANLPWTSHAAWLLSQMIRWGYVEKPIDVRALARRVYRPDLHREAAADVGLPAPLVDEKVEGAHGDAWLLEEASTLIAMGPDRFFDGQRFDPEQIVAYLERFPVSSLRVRLDELAEHN